MQHKRIACTLMAALIAAAVCLPVEAASKPLPSPWEDWYDRWEDVYDDDEYDGYYYDYYVDAEPYAYFYEPGSAAIRHDGHGNFTVDDTISVISGSDGFVTVIQPDGGTAGETDFYPFYPNSWQGNGPTGGGSYTGSGDVVQSNGTLGTLSFRGVSMTVYEGTTDANLLKGAAHFSGTSAWNGNVCLAGHNRGPNAWFYRAKDLSYGDTITYSTALGSRQYSVTNVRIVSVNDLSPLNGSEENMLTLVTCVANRPQVRLIVTAAEMR